jgi:hypothetical protein
MKTIKPGLGRAIISREGNNLWIVVPPERNLMGYVFFGIFMGAGLIGEYSVVSNFSFPVAAGDLLSKELFGLVFMTFWCCLVLYSFCSSLFGKEMIRLDNTVLVYKNAIFGVGRNKSFMVSQVKKLRTEVPPPSDDGEGGKTPPAPGKRNVMFDYGRATHVIATNLDAADANFVIDAMCKQARSLGIPY